ncbi:RICIN domain-containing protein [Campylobacter canadensis]|uniref:Cytolethal distending toxin subunit A n=1 Tax=Campylobacter canadensis TaxID=449520 RepID=A0ABS7WTI9_9BACT|nr:toxin [Campylobacter canadensis]MBZ7988096.1 toxin [Campylobacter canadensis]MBZ7995546.1 toxin [Campylobacter canadensis]MBZ7997343.1 toxin [Campylobacter canadensis]MBZ7999071.1 toxin [Campylobacter canadensis]MBZ8000886.1 toxin [Campylobacter canadensis]
MKKSTLLISVFCILTFVSCASKNTINKENFLLDTQIVDNQDILKIGLNPSPPTKEQKDLKPFAGPNLSKFLAKPTLNAANSSKKEDISDMVAIMSSNAGVLTIWATNPGNWIWGYPARDSRPFKGARIWQIITLSDGSVMFKNYQHKTCISAYNNGIIHLPCNEQSPSQKWTLIRFSNQAWQIKNVAKQSCLQTPTFRHTIFYSIFLTKCASSKNLDQQWYITAPLISTKPIFVLN